MKKILIPILLLILIVETLILFQKIQTNHDVDLGEPLFTPEIIHPQKSQYQPEFVKVQVYRNSESGTVYGDVISHVQGNPHGDANGRSTNAHETTHSINSEIKSSHYNQSVNCNGFYVLEGRGVVLQEPKIKMSNIVQFVPQNLRSYRWHLYMENNILEWNDTPTYIFDEWTAYVNGGACAVDDVKQNKYVGGWRDAVSGCCDFSIYAIALAMSVKKNDPEYWIKNNQFKNFVIWELKNAQKIFIEGRIIKNFKWKVQDDLLLEFLTSQSAEEMRQFCKFELDGVWIDIKPDLIRNINYDDVPQIVQLIKHGARSCSFQEK